MKPKVTINGNQFGRSELRTLMHKVSKRQNDGTPNILEWIVNRDNILKFRSVLTSICSKDILVLKILKKKDVGVLLLLYVSLVWEFHDLLSDELFLDIQRFASGEKYEKPVILF
jgi:hypothetical protein